MLVVVNPAAGRSALADAVITTLQARGINPDIHRTQGPGDATRHVAGVAARYDMVVAAGGDGTLNEVINGLGDHDITLGLIPAGTTNVLATELGYPSDATAIAGVLAGNRELPVYLATVNGRRFSMMTGIGYDAWVVAGVDLAQKKRIGKLAYVLSMLRELRRYGSRRYRVRIDGIDHPARSAVITNGRHYGGSYTLTRQADITQPFLQVVLVQASSRLQFLAMLFMLPLGMVEKLWFIRSLRGRDIRVELEDGPAPDPVQADGDTVTQLPADIRVEARPVRMRVP